MKTRIALTLTLALALSLPAAWAGERIITLKNIRRTDGVIRILMPCDWIKTEGSMKLVGLYGDTFERRDMPEATITPEPCTKPTECYVEVAIPETDRVGLNEAVLEFTDSGKRCPDDIGQSNFTQ